MTKRFTQNSILTQHQIIKVSKRYFSTVGLKQLRHLDVLEDYPKYYTRRPETVLREDTDEEVECLVYFLLRYARARILFFM